MTPDIIDIRRFDPQDFLPLLNAESRAWEEGLHWNFNSSSDVIINCLREKRLAGYALVVDNLVQGYCFFFYDGEKGLIGDLFVEPSHEDTHRARRLLDHVVETLLATPGIQRVEAQLPHYGLEALEPCFQAHGFKSYRRRFMARSFERDIHPEIALTLNSKRVRERRPNPEDFTLQPWERKFDREAAALLYDAYRGHVDACINDQYSSQAGAARLIENIVHQRGCGEFLPRVSRVALHRPSQRLAGVLGVTSVRSRTAHIPQIAISTAFQGRGLGTLMMERAFEELGRTNYREITLTVTDANAGAVRLYERLEFATFRSFGAFVYPRR